MDLKELLDYTVGGAKWLAAGGGAYVALVVSHVISNSFSEKIKNQDDLDRITEEESKKLGISKKVTSQYYDYFEGGAVKWCGDYFIGVGGFYAKRGMVRHELYHIHKGDCDKKQSKLKYYLLNEPRAILYEVFRLKL